MVNDIESDMLAGKAAPPSDIDTYLGRRVAEFNFVIQDYIPGTIISVRSHGADPSTVIYRIRYDKWKEQDVLKQDLPLLFDNFRAKFGQDDTKLTTEDEPTRRSRRKRKLTTVKIGNYTVLAQDMNDSDESKSFEGGLKPSSKKSAPKSSAASKKPEKPPKKKMKKDNISSSKVRDERCVSKTIPPEILERFFHESGNSSKTKEVTLKKQVLHGSTFENTDNFCGKIVTPIVQSHKYGKFKLYFVLHFDGEEEMMYLTPLFRNGIVKTTGMNKYCVNVIPSTGPVTADSCWKAMNVIHVPCSEWRIVESRAISKTPDVRCEKWEIFEPEFDRIDIPVYRKPKGPTAPRTKHLSSSVKHSSESAYPTSEDEDENSEKESDATSDTGDENSVAILYHDERRNESIIKSHLSNENGSEDTGSLVEEGNTVNSVSKPSKDYSQVFVGDTFDKQSNEKEGTDISGDTVTSSPMNKTNFKLLDTIPFKSPFKRVEWDRIDGIIQGGKVKDDMKSPDGVAMSQGQSRKFSEDSRVCESPMAHERLGIVKTEASEDRQDEEDIILKGITFDQGFEALVAFKNKYNHVSVPWNYTDTPWLSAWCNQKRVHYNNYQNMSSQDENGITENQVRELKNIGFDFHDRTNQTFDEKLNELKEFKRIYGHDWFEHWRDKMRTDAKKRGLSDNALSFRRKAHSNPNKERNLLMKLSTSGAPIHAFPTVKSVGGRQSPLGHSTPAGDGIAEYAVNKHTEHTMSAASPVAYDVTAESIIDKRIKHTVVVPLGALGIHVAVGADKQLYISRILPQCPISDEVQENDIITHLNDEEINGDPVLFSNMLMNTMEGGRSLTILRHASSSNQSPEEDANSSLVAAGGAFANDVHLKATKSETLVEPDCKDSKPVEASLSVSNE